MGKYGEVAVNAARLLDADSKKSPLDAWNAAAKAKFRGEIEAEKKSCPRGAFLGLCEEGLVRGVVPGEYTGSDKNKSYALEAVRHLLHDPGLERRRPGRSHDQGARPAVVVGCRVPRLHTGSAFHDRERNSRSGRSQCAISA